MKTVYCYDSAGFFTGSTEAQASPMETDVYLMPPNSTEEKPPEAEQGKRARWNGTSWKLVQVEIDDQQLALAKLKDFLNNNPDVAALVNGGN